MALMIMKPASMLASHIPIYDRSGRGMQNSDKNDILTMNLRTNIPPKLLQAACKLIPKDITKMFKLFGQPISIL